jgi:hypothetical protein
VRRRLKRDGNPLLEMVQAADPTVDEMQFNDSLTGNLRRGRFLLLIVGDGIREGVEAIAEYLQAHAGLHFSLGLVELPIYVLPDGGRLVVPRVLARTTVITRTVVAIPDGYVLQETQDETVAEVDPDRSVLADEQQRFWAEFLDVLKLDDPEQPKPRPARMGFLAFSLPAPGGNCWLTVYCRMVRGEVGIFLSSTRNTAGEYEMESIVDGWDALKSQLGGDARLSEKEGRLRIVDTRTFASLKQAEVRGRAFTWLGERVNTFVNVLRPLVRSAVADYQSRSEQG